MGFNILTDERQGAPVTFGDPGEKSSFGQYLKTASDLATPQGAAMHIGLEIAKNPRAYADLFGAAERNTMLVDTITARNEATEAAYDRRIRAIKEATGVDLPNPLRGGFQQEVTRQARARRDAMLTAMPDDEAPDIVTGGQLFDQRLAELREKHPDKLDALTFGDINAEAKAIAAGAEKEYAAARKNEKLDPVAGLATEFAGGFWGARRDPLFVGSLFAGPTSAVGKTAVSRVASSALFQGLYNAGISALEQPAVQAWRGEIGAKSGVMPAIENVGMAFLFGLIPGAAIRGIHEAGRPAIRRTLDGVPERGDIDVALKAVDSELAPHESAAVRMGEDMADADRVTAPPKPKDVPAELHDDLSAAALKRADDPLNQPSPEAVAAVRAMDTETVAGAALRDSQGNVYSGITHADALIKAEDAGAKLGDLDEGFLTSTGRYVDRQEAKTIASSREQISPYYPSEYLHSAILEAKPKTLHEAQMAATEAIEEQGNRASMAATRAAMERDRLPVLKLEAEKVINFPESPDGKTPASTATRYRIADDKGGNNGVLDVSEQGKNLEIVWVGGEHGEKVDLGPANVRHLFRELKRLYPEANTISGARISGAHRPPGTAAPEVKVPLNPPASSKDPLDKIPVAKDDGTPGLVSAKTAAKAGERETFFAALVRECK